MKLAEALQERADLNRRIEQLRSRIQDNSLVQENEEPAEDPAELLKELDACIERLCELMTSINLANASVKKDGKTVTQMIAEKDTLTLKISAYRDLVAEASRTTDRARHTEIRIVSTVNVRKIQKQIDTMAKQLRILDNQIQEINWTTEL